MKVLLFSLLALLWLLFALFVINAFLSILRTVFSDLGAIVEKTLFRARAPEPADEITPEPEPFRLLFKLPKITLRPPRISIPSFKLSLPPFPFRLFAACLCVSICVIIVLMVVKTPDIYGYAPLFSALARAAAACFIVILLHYSLHALSGADLEDALIPPGPPSESPPDHANLFLEIRADFLTLLLLAILLFGLHRFSISKFMLAGFLVSSLYFVIFTARAAEGFTLIRFIRAWALFLAVAGTAFSLAYRLGAARTPAGARALILSALFIVPLQVLHTMHRRYDLAKGLRELFFDRYWTLFRLFLLPLLKAACAVVASYFIVMTFSLNAFCFYVFLAIVLLAALLRARFPRLMPRWTPRGPFAAFVLLVLLCAAFVQSFNRLPPPAPACARLRLPEDEVVPVLTMEQYRKHFFLEGAMPYGVALDPDEHALFVSFKNLSGSGALVRLDDRDFSLAARLITESDRDPDELFYPERLCINTRSRTLFATTKSSANFQILVLDYSAGLKLKRRLRFPQRETTNCRVRPDDGALFIIFLGPPNNSIQLRYPRSLKPLSEIRFGTFGYADYFTFDDERRRLVVPSLDPTNLFSIYQAYERTGGLFHPVSVPVVVRAPLPGGLSIPLRVPTLGIAHDPRRERLYLTSPFTRLIIELDAGTLRPLRAVRSSGGFPREIAADVTHGALLVANFASGSVDVLDSDSLSIVRTYRLGKLVRTVYADPVSSRNFAVTACGVFEIHPGKILARYARKP
ncbi:MAG: hypothetical protein AB1742_14665 [bacterium]